MKSPLVEANAARLEAIEAGEQIVVGVNRFTDDEPSPLTAGDDQIMVMPRPVEAEQIARLKAWRDSATRGPREAALAELRAPRRKAEHRPAFHRRREGGRHHRRMGQCHARRLRGIPRPHWRPPTARQSAAGSTPCAARSSASPPNSASALKLFVGKPGLDGHSNGAEQIAVRARDCGFDVIYAGIRSTPAESSTPRRRRASIASACPSSPARM